jgi:hypothetical protein
MAEYLGKGCADVRWFKALAPGCQCDGPMKIRFPVEVEGFCSGIKIYILHILNMAVEEISRMLTGDSGKSKCGSEIQGCFYLLRLSVPGHIQCLKKH